MVSETAPERLWLQHNVDAAHDHIRGDPGTPNSVTVVFYGDYLCPFCRRLRPVLRQLRDNLGERLIYVYRHFPNEAAHPGATFIAQAVEAAAQQGHFWDLHDWLYDNPAPSKEALLQHIRSLGIDMDRFQHDLQSDDTRGHVEQDRNRGLENGVTGTPTIFVDGLRYDGAWDFYSMLEALDQPVAARIQRSARVFASLPASGGLALLFAAAAALLAANTPLAPAYNQFVNTRFGIGEPGSMLSLRIGEWCSEGLLAIFFLVVGLDIRRELTTGSLTNPRAALLPVIAAIGGVVAPTTIYLLLNSGPTAPGWSIPTATDIAFALGILALFGPRIPTSLRVFVAAYAVVDDILSVLTLAIFYPRGFSAFWIAMGTAMIVILYALNRWRVYAAWPYVLTAAMLWLCLHSAGIHGALAGIILAAFLPTLPRPAVAALLAQAATALAALESEQKEASHSGSAKKHLEEEAIWEWATLNLSAASDRLLSPADRTERAVSSWTAYFILPLFAFSATGIALNVSLSSPQAMDVLFGVVLGLLVGKPAGISVVSALAIKTKFAIAPAGISMRNFFGAACLCGVGDTVSILMADQAFPQGPNAAIAKIGVLIGSILAAALGAFILGFGIPSAEITKAATASS